MGWRRLLLMLLGLLLFAVGCGKAEEPASNSSSFVAETKSSSAPVEKQNPEIGNPADSGTEPGGAPAEKQNPEIGDPADSGTEPGGAPAEKQNPEIGNPADLPAAPSLQAFSLPDWSQLRGTDGLALCVLPFQEGGDRVDISGPDAAQRTQQLFDKIPLEELMPVEAPEAFDEETATWMTGSWFEYFWYIQPEYTLVRMETGEEYYTSSSQSFYDLINCLPKSYPELFDEPAAASVDEDGRVNPPTG